MVVVIKIPSRLHQNFFHFDVDLPFVLFYSIPEKGYPLRVGELLADARCDLPLLELSNFPLKMM